MMFSPEEYPTVGSIFDPRSQLEQHWRGLAQEHGFQALLLISVQPNARSFEVTSSWNVPIAPFNGADKPTVMDVLGDCFRRHPKYHVHAIKNFALAQLIKKYSKSEAGTTRMWFVPISCEGNYFVFLGFVRHDSDRAIPETFAADLANVLFVTAAVASHREISHRLAVMEIFVKEVGHDFATSVQAAVATLRNITQGRIRGDAIPRKARDVEEEIMSAYRIADALGIAVEANYQIREPDDYDLSDVLARVIDRHRAEAEERGNRVKMQTNIRSLPMWGDRKAIEVALGHLVMNAIKYSFPRSSVLISTERGTSEVIVRVTNSGLRLPTGEELHDIWKFGYRGQEAKEQHVNGSGIGLYTVRKIAAGHSGNATVIVDSQNPDTSHFEIRLPTNLLQSKLTL
jgi:signal transduction histidine kinase